jgi:hypothetical protein
MIVSHWKIAFLLLQLGLLAITAALVKPMDPIDGPWFP